MADKLGYTILLLGISNIKKKIIQLRVHPCLVSKNSLLAKVKNELKRIMVHGILHLLDYNDKSKQEQKIMREKENFYINLSD